MITLRGLLQDIDHILNLPDTQSSDFYPHRIGLEGELSAPYITKALAILPSKQ